MFQFQKMPESLLYKKAKGYWKGEKHSGTSNSDPKPVLDAVNEEFLQHVVEEEGKSPLLPASSKDDDQGSYDTSNEMTPEKLNEDKNIGKEEKKKKAGWLHSRTQWLRKKQGRTQTHSITGVDNELAREEDELGQVLEDLNLIADNSRAFSFSKESSELIQKFTIVLKDLINGVPTAYNDLVHLLDSSNGTLSKSYDSLPDFFKKMIGQVFERAKKSMGPEIFAATAGVPGMFGKGAATTGIGVWEAIAKPQAIVTLLREILLLLRLRWPAFMATNILLSLAIFVLLFVLWYCHKRGKEVRMTREAQQQSEGRIIELEDDATIKDSDGKEAV